jgi:regulator of protease activity HflC (stomatin/prohibitin superfamily)
MKYRQGLCFSEVAMFEFDTFMFELRPFLFDMSPFLFFVIAVAVLAFLVIAIGVKIVPQSESWTVERFGRYVRTLTPGLNIITPFIEGVGQKLSLQEVVLDIPPQDVIILDNATVTTDGVVFYQVIDAPKAAYEVHDLERAISNLAMTNLRSVIGSMALDDVLSKRDDINTRLLRVVDAATDPWGLKVTRIEIKDLTPPRDLVRAMNQQMMAERQKRAEILQAEGEKQAAILRAEGEKESIILEAEGRREAAFRDAEAREREAKAEAKATTSVSEAIGKNGGQAINYFIAQKYVTAFEKLAQSDNQKILFLPM